MLSTPPSAATITLVVMPDSGLLSFGPPYQHAWLAQVYERADVLQAHVASLDVICMTYNSVQEKLLLVERPLLQAKIEVVDDRLRDGLLVRTTNDV